MAISSRGGFKYKSEPTPESSSALKNASGSNTSSPAVSPGNSFEEPCPVNTGTSLKYAVDAPPS